MLRRRPRPGFGASSTGLFRSPAIPCTRQEFHPSNEQHARLVHGQDGEEVDTKCKTHPSRPCPASPTFPSAACIPTHGQSNWDRYEMHLLRLTRSISHTRGMLSHTNRILLVATAKGGKCQPTLVCAGSWNGGVECILEEACRRLLSHVPPSQFPRWCAGRLLPT